MQAMAEAMTADKGLLSAAARETLLRRIAKTAKHQGNFHLACKKYTQVCLLHMRYMSAGAVACKKYTQVRLLLCQICGCCCMQEVQ
jgi:hypothetical protein